MINLYPLGPANFPENSFDSEAQKYRTLSSKPQIQGIEGRIQVGNTRPFGHVALRHLPNACQKSKIHFAFPQIVYMLISQNKE